jgi:hypothetical protein
MKQWPVKPLLLDFDGVLHGYPKGRSDGFLLKDPIVSGAVEFIAEAQEHFQVSVYSARSIDFRAQAMMRQYLSNHKVEVDRLQWPFHKPPAWLTIDDRCICFKGEFPSMKELLEFKAWCE